MTDSLDWITWAVVIGLVILALGSGDPGAVEPSMW